MLLAGNVAAVTSRISLWCHLFAVFRLSLQNGCSHREELSAKEVSYYPVWVIGLPNPDCAQQERIILPPWSLVLQRLVLPVSKCVYLVHHFTHLSEESFSAAHCIYINPLHPYWNTLNIVIFNTHTRHIHKGLGKLKLGKFEWNVCFHQGYEFNLIRHLIYVGSVVVSEKVRTLLINGNRLQRKWSLYMFPFSLSQFPGPRKQIWL
jgi:hypothetical protein